MNISLKYYRKKKKLTQIELSKLTGISQSYISKLEQEKFIHSVSSKDIILLSDILGIDQLILTEYFLNKEREYLEKVNGYDKKAVKTLDRDFTEEEV